MDVETNTIEIGGPTIFVQAPDGLWGEFELPPGKRVENGDSFSIFDCRFLGMLYPVIVLALDGDKEMVAAHVWGAARRAYRRGDVDDASFKRFETYLGERFPYVEMLARAYDRAERER